MTLMINPPQTKNEVIRSLQALKPNVRFKVLNVTDSENRLLLDRHIRQRSSAGKSLSVIVIEQ